MYRNKLKKEVLSLTTTKEFYVVIIKGIRNDREKNKREKPRKTTVLCPVFNIHNGKKGY
jgi:hypothetical protein